MDYINLPNSGIAPIAQPFGMGKLGMTIDEAADCTGIGRSTLRKLVAWGKSLSCESAARPLSAPMSFAPLWRSIRAAICWTVSRSGK